MKRNLAWRARAAAALLLSAGIHSGSGADEPVTAPAPVPSTASAAVDSPPVDSTSRQLANLKMIVPKDEKGGFIRPRFSPDGLQLMLSRAGFQGIYVVAATGGKPTLIKEANAFTARWTKDGKIGIRQDDKVNVLNLDGTAARVEEVAVDSVYCERDRVYAVPENGAPPVPITDSSDRFIDPKMCPKHKGVAYIGIQTGLYISRADGTGKPLFLGPGEDVSWGPEAAFLIFGRSRDDGHRLVEGDLYCYDTKGKKLFNLTGTTDLLLKSPSLSPDGKVVALEAEGAIYTGTIQ